MFSYPAGFLLAAIVTVDAKEENSSLDAGILIISGTVHSVKRGRGTGP